MISSSNEVSFCIGATNELIPGKWSWIDASPFEYTEGAPSEPENVSGGNCVASSLVDATWSAESCFKAKPFICLIQEEAVSSTISTTKTITTTTKKPLSCPSGWTFFETTGFCYFSNTDCLLYSKDEGENYCISQNSHLASIHSLIENDFVVDLSKQKICSSKIL